MLLTALAISAMTYTIHPLPDTRPSRSKSRPTEVCRDAPQRPTNPKQEPAPAKTDCRQQPSDKIKPNRKVPK